MLCVKCAWKVMCLEWQLLDDHFQVCYCIQASPSRGGGTGSGGLAFARPTNMSSCIATLFSNSQSLPCASKATYSCFMLALAPQYVQHGTHYNWFCSTHSYFAWPTKNCFRCPCWASVYIGIINIPSTWLIQHMVWEHPYSLPSTKNYLPIIITTGLD